MCVSCVLCCVLYYVLCAQVGLLGPDGQDLPLHLEGKGDVGTSTILRCDAAQNSFTFTDVPVSFDPQVVRLL